MTPLCRHNVNKYGGVRWDRGSISVWWVQPSALNNDVGLIDGRNDMSLLSCSKSIYVYSWRLTVFTARCMCIAGNVLSQDVCPFVCLSVTHRYYVETAKYNLSFFFAGGVNTSFHLQYQTLRHYSDGTLNGTSNASGVWKYSRFSTNISLYLQNDTKQARCVGCQENTYFFHMIFEWKQGGGNSYYETARGTRMRYTEGCHFEWSWVT